MTLEDEYYFIYKTLDNDNILSKYRNVGQQIDVLFKSKDKSAKNDLKAEYKALYKIGVERKLINEMDKIESMNSSLSDGDVMTYLITGFILLGIGLLIGALVAFILSKVPFLFYGLLLFSIVIIGFSFKSFYLAIFCKIKKNRKRSL